MKNLRIISITAAALFSAAAFANLKVVTTTSDLASIVSAIGGNKVSVSSLITGARDAHRIEAKPSYMSRVGGADMFVAVGLELEVGYEQPILTGSANRRVAIGAPGHVYASDYAYILEKPTGSVSRAMGDIHPYGNPHVWLDPYNGRQIAKGLESKMSSLDPANAASYRTNLEHFLGRLDVAMFGSALVGKYGGPKLWEMGPLPSLRSRLTEAGTLGQLGGWAAQMMPFVGKPVITYHRSMSYLANRFGLKVVEELEPKPGLDPTPGHLAEVMRTGKAEGAKAIIEEPFYSRRHADFVASRIGANVVVIPQSVGQESGANDYVSLFDVIVSKIAGGLR
jgi:zinc/manganese transport system substrate-binding protein